MKPLALPPDWLPPYAPDDAEHGRIVYVDPDTWEAAVALFRTGPEAAAYAACRAYAADTQRTAAANASLRVLAEARFQEWREALEREAEERFGPRED